MVGKMGMGLAARRKLMGKSSQGRDASAIRG